MRMLMILQIAETVARQHCAIATWALQYHISLLTCLYSYLQIFSSALIPFYPVAFVKDSKIISKCEVLNPFLGPKYPKSEKRR
jgi:hypothetical protein